MQVSYEVGSSRSEQEISTKANYLCYLQRFLSNYKNASFVLNLHRVLTIFNKQPEDDQNYAYIQLKEQND